MNDEPVELTDDIINHSTDIANLIIEGIFTREEPNYDPATTMFSLFIGCIHHLHWMGWSTQELVNEVFNHAEEPIEDDEEDDE